MIANLSILVRIFLMNLLKLAQVVLQLLKNDMFKNNVLSVKHQRSSF